jgi:hypothetical protein
MNWEYKSKKITDLPEDVFGFIYKLTFIKDGKEYYYIGKKQTHSYITKQALKNGKQRDNAIKRFGKNRYGKRVYFEVIKKENDWREYTGSADIPEGYKLTKKEIIQFCYDKRELTYLEAKHQFLNEVLENDSYLNNNILGKFFNF